MRFITALLSLIALMASPASAHTAAGSGFAFLDGILHPLMGADHLLVMIGVGLWAGMTGGKARWIWPVAFVSVMAVGGAAALAGMNLWFAEGLILASVAAIGAVVGLGLQPPVVIGAIACGLAAFAHGHAHGTELPLGASAVGYVAGFLTATVALHVSGIIMWSAAGHSKVLARAAGIATVAAGGLLAFG